MNIGISIDSLAKKFGEVNALVDINVDISKGSIVGLLGKNGAGKSTLVRLLSGVMKPTKGSVKIYGYDIFDDLDDVKRITGLLPEEYALYEKLSIYEYVEFIGRLYDLNSEQIESRFNKLSCQLGILELQNRLIETLSKGQKQKVAIITALIHEPQVVFFDEPISNLDVQSQRIVKNMILEYKNQSRIILIATHLLRNVESICDELLVIDEGKILFSGSIHSFQGNHKSLEDAYIKFMEEI